ncbi:MAG: hypothetical protein EOO11_16835 [Chitinophagaceae bacterium]|nr:MAG: hypothetical protein EOO11_16835 [Chitinophagaceae bacterium]
MRAFLLIALLFSALFAGAQDTEKAQRIKASYLLALGRLPSSGELQYWNGQANVPVGTLVDLHKQYLKGNPSVLRVVVTKSYADALGYARMNDAQ